MATLYTTAFEEAYIDNPFNALDNDMNGGMPHRLFGSFTLAGDLAQNDVIKFFRLPAGARIVSARLVAPAATDGDISVGWSASEKGGETASAAGILAAQDISSAVDAEMSWSEAGHNKEFSESVDIQITVAGATDGATGDVWKLEVYFVNN